MTAATLHVPVCSGCATGDHCHGGRSVPSGRMVPDRDPYRDRDRMLREHVRCGCECGVRE